MSVVHLLSCVRFCDPRDCSMPGLPVLYCPPGFALTHVHWVGDAIQPSHLLLPLLLPSSIFTSIRAFSNESVLCIKWQNIGASASASVLPMNNQCWFPLGLTGFILLSKGLSRVSPAPQFKSINSLALSLYCPTLTSIPDYWKNHSFDYMDLYQQRDVSALLVFMYLDAPLLGAHVLMTVISSCIVTILLSLQYNSSSSLPSLLFFIAFVLKSTLSGMSIAPPPLSSYFHFMKCPVCPKVGPLVGSML